MPRRPPLTTLFPYTTLFRSDRARVVRAHLYGTMVILIFVVIPVLLLRRLDGWLPFSLPDALRYPGLVVLVAGSMLSYASLDRKSTRLNSSHATSSYAVFCFK